MKLLDDQELHPLVFATRMAVMAFVRATCSRSGSVCKDWFDRAGKMLYWLQRNVLSVGDYIHVGARSKSLGSAALNHYMACILD